MKNKPQRHKESNTFKFQPFSERIANINVDIFHHVAHRYEEDAEDSETFLYQSLQKWNVLNLSESYDQLRKNIVQHNIQTLPQLLIQKDRVISVLLDHLSSPNSLSLQAALEFVVALVRDLRQEFYPHYPKFHSKLIELLNTKDTDQLEWTFTCLAYLFKFLWRFLVRDLTTVFESLLPLLSTNKPQYINNFAAESFAFVARKVKDRRSFLKLILRSLLQNPDGIPGCGRLLFETIRGVSGQFHTCAESFITFLLQSLSDDNLPRKLLFNVLNHMVLCIPEVIYIKHSSLFWDTIKVAIDNCITQWKTEKSERITESMNYLLQLIVTSLKYKGGSFLVNPTALVNDLVHILEETDWPENVFSTMVDISSTLFIGLRINLSQEVAAKLIRKMLSIQNKVIVQQFVEKTLNYSGFDTLILPGAMTLCCQLGQKESTDLLSKIVLCKIPPPASVEKFQQWKRYPLDVFSKSKEYAMKLNDFFYTALDIDKISDIMSNKEQILQALTIIPHLLGIDKTIASRKISALITCLCKYLANHAMDPNVHWALMILFIAVVTLLLVNKDEALKLVELLVKTLLQFVLDSKYVTALKALGILINAVGRKQFLSTAGAIMEKIKEHLASPFREVRLATIHILLQLDTDCVEDTERKKILSIIYSAETVPVTVHDYREKVKQLQLLECNDSPERLSLFVYPLKYLLGCLYINFKLIWEPVMKLISSYALHLPATQFWQLFEPHLRLVVENIKDGASSSRLEINFESEFLNELFKNHSSLEDKPDHTNYRILLWQNMTQFTDMCEVKNRDIANLFLSFLQDEYFRKNVNTATTWNIKQKKNLESDDIVAMEVDGDRNEDEEIKNILVKSSEEELNKSFRSTGKTATQSLLAHLGVFAKLRNPRSIFREPELNKAYFEFLTHKNPAIQKAALDCIMSYKNKSVTPYRDHLYGLIEDKTFKDEVVLFRIDTESDLIRPEHRSDLIPVVMRIVYSKMLNKSGVRTGGNNSNSIRRNVVFRFLAGCKEEELMQYLQMAFRIFSPLVKDDAKAMVQEIMSSLDLEQMIPPKRLMSTVNLLMVVLSQCGSLMGNTLLHFLLRILLCVGATITAALRVRDEVHLGYLNVLKNIRNLCIDVLTRFFNSFETYSWSADELDIVFEVFVWPWLEKLPIEGIHSPTSLMKLFTSWSYNPRYFVLLSKHHELDSTVTPLPYIMKLLIANKVHGSVLGTIMDMVERMLTLREATKEEQMENDDEEATPSLPELPLNNKLSLNSETLSKFKMSEDLNFGTCLLLPHTPEILEYMQKKLTKNGPKRGLPQRDINILSRITECVNDASISDSLLSLLFPIISKKSGSSEDILCPLLTTVTNLMKNVEKPSHYLRKIAPLFGAVSGSEPRKMLTRLVLLISSEENKLDAALLEDLNAWDAKWLDQPDFMRRLDAFKKIKMIIASGEMTVEMGIIIIHTCYYFLQTEKDLSLRDSAGQCLRSLCPALSQSAEKEKDFVINQTILTLLSAGIRNKKNDIVQQESIAVLGFMVRECAHLHSVLKDLSLLSNKTDLEVDFFENLQHLQLHRKVRALLKFCDVSKKLTKSPSPRTLTQFVLPLVSQFLCSERYVNKNSVVDAAIEALGTICRFLPWHQYEMILRYYLGKLRHALEFQKQLIRIVVAILNAFHFDLSRAKLGKNLVSEEIKEEDEIKTEVKTDIIKDDTENAEEIESEVEKENEEEKEFEENLLKDVTEEEQEEEDQTEILVNEVFAIEKQNILTEAAATRVVHVIRTGLLPQLNRTISMRVQSDNLHKVNRKMAGPDRDEEDILRIPIVLAFVKLLQRLPAQVMEQNLSGVLMKLCTFLKSRLDSVRRVTRETLQKVMVTLGPEYLNVLLEEMTTLLTRGFHMHVLVYSVHSVLVALKDLFQPGHMDLCVPRLLQVCKLDLFGNVAEEKEVAQITAKLMEAKASKSYDMFHLMAQFVTDKCLLDIILPLKEELTCTLSHKATNKASECLRQIVLGLVDNQFVSMQSLLVFAYGTASESIPVLIDGRKKEEIKENNNELPFIQRPDTFIIQAEPKSRPRVEGKLCAKTNAHILVEFGLRLYYFMLKRDKLKGDDFRPHLDPFVIVLRDSLKSQHVKLSTLALQCLCWVLKFDLPSLKESLDQISKNLFQLLHKYASAGLSKGDNFDLVMAAFKAVAVLVRDVKYYTISTDQLRALLLYCEQDIQDYSRQATAFTLLKAVIKRKLVAQELHSVMEKVAKISITAELDSVRLQARQVFHQFLIDYPMGKKLNKYISFYISQLLYELHPGRQSAMEMLKLLITTFPQNTLLEQSGLFFVNLGACLVNDDIPECRKKAADIIMLLLEKVDKNQVDKLFDIVLLWMKDIKVIHRRLGAQLCGLFAVFEKKEFARHLPSLLPIILNQFSEGFVENKPGHMLRVEENISVNVREKLQDHHLYQVMHMIVKISVHCPTFLTDSTFIDQVESLAENAQSLLAHPHEWVRLCAAQFLGKVMSVNSPRDISAILNNPQLERPGFLLNNSRVKVKSLALDFCAQLTPGAETEDKLLMQTMKNLVFMAEVLKDVKEVPDKDQLSLVWLVRRFRKVINSEITQAPTFSTVRTMAFNWMAAIVLKLDKEDIQPVLHHIMAPLVRELNIVENEGMPLYQVAKEAAKYVKRKIGAEEYNNLLAKLTTQINIKRAERRKERAQQVITQPERAAKRKISKQLKKKDQKKRKLEYIKGHKARRKPKKTELDFGI